MPAIELFDRAWGLASAGPPHVGNRGLGDATVSVDRRPPNRPHSRADTDWGEDAGAAATSEGGATRRGWRRNVLPEPSPIHRRKDAGGRSSADYASGRVPASETGGGPEPPAGPREHSGVSDEERAHPQSLVGAA